MKQNFPLNVVKDSELTYVAYVYGGIVWQIVKPVCSGSISNIAVYATTAENRTLPLTWQTVNIRCVMKHESVA